MNSQIIPDAVGRRKHMSGCDQGAAALEGRPGGIIVAQESNPRPGTLAAYLAANDLLVVTNCGAAALLHIEQTSRHFLRVLGKDGSLGGGRGHAIGTAHLIALVAADLPGGTQELGKGLVALLHPQLIQQRSTQGDFWRGLG